ncbi:selenocysteine-specific elongation factor [Rhagoletis pomonella]|uniref:selenocysteine-specific elongation factor n=1 Tax=Rhagoletis pomonella TaxID=28610 RepID=UPI001786C9E3|nr:selenocysteine-specific elongation factor [Rhagoletis pomonella]
MIININIGLLGHVDSGKTTLARALSTIASTAAFDKNPQSQERGITLDLGFSAVVVEAPASLKCISPQVEQVQFTFVDCPGHASLIRTIIGGAQIIDLMLLVVDAQKGIQTQTAECIVIGELLRRKLIIVVNKIDLLEQATRAAQLQKLNARLRKTLAQTTFDPVSSIVNVSAMERINVEELLDTIVSQIEIPKRNKEAPLVMYSDHCFSIKGQGTICTGTIVQGSIDVNDLVEIPAIKEQRKVKSIQMFRRPVQSAAMGDRVGICVPQFNAKTMERGILAKPGYLHNVYAACIRMNRIRFYKFAIRSKSKLHITIGHDTVMANVTLFKSISTESEGTFNLNNEYEFIEELEPVSNVETQEHIFALLEFQTPILANANATLIAAKLDLDAQSNSCRLAFWGQMIWYTHSNNYALDELQKFKVFKRKLKQGYIQRLVNENEVIVDNLFSKQGNRDVYIGKVVELSTGERGVIESTFGQKSKVKVHFPNGLKTGTLNELKSGRFSSIQVLLRFKKYIFNKQLLLVQ